MPLASSGTAKVTLPTDDQILITREFAAPKHLVYKAVTTPELVKRWWHAKRGEVTVAEIDLRVGGKWRYVIVADGGLEVGFHGEYREIVPNERIVSTEVFEGIPDADEHASLNTLTLSENDARTTMTVLVQHRTKEDRDAQINSGMEAGMQDAYDLLEEVAVSIMSETPELPQPDPALRRLDRLVGTWSMEGNLVGSDERNIKGETTFRWLPGGFFLEQRVHIDFAGLAIDGLELIGYDPETDTFPSTVYSGFAPTPLPYRWDVRGDDVTIAVTYGQMDSTFTGFWREDGTFAGGWRPNPGADETVNVAYDISGQRLE